MKRLGAGLLLAVVVLAGCGRSAHDLGRPPVDRVLIVSLPGVGWSDVQTRDLPHLRAFVDDAAIGQLSTRIGRANATPTSAYLTMGAGTRAIAPTLDKAVALDPDESYGGVPASELIERRRGAVSPEIFYLPVGAAIDINDDSSFGGEVGMLGDALDRAGVDRAVIANADAAEGFVSDEPPPEGSYARSAATALMDSNGLVPSGTVGRSLLMDDPDAPFGRRFDPEAVTTAFADVWSGDDRTVTLVEASDLSRAAAYGPRATPQQRSRLRTEALEQADALLGDLLEQVDPERDAVAVLSPVAPTASPALGIAAVRAPGVSGGLLESATTRRAGYVQLADVAPTILELLGLEEPDDIEGRSFQVVDRGATGRIAKLADAAEAADFRDGLLPLVVTLIILVIAVLVAATRWRERLSDRLRGFLRPLAYGILGVVPATFLVGRLSFAASTGGYIASVVGIAVLVALGATAVERRWPGAGPIACVGLIVVVVTGDVIFGAPLQLNTVFGYSVGVAGRFAGIGNLAFALFGSATIVLAVLIAERGGRHALWGALGLLAAVVLVEGLPMLGADVGGVLSMVPAFGITALVLSGRRVRSWELAALGVGTVVALLGFAFIDAARAPQKHTHLARLAEHVLDGRWGAFFGSLSRRWQASFGGAELAGWITIALLAAVTILYVSLVGTGRMGINGPRSDRCTNALMAGLVVLGVVGLIANDSSFAVPATTLIVVAPVLVLRTLRPTGGHP